MGPRRPRRASLARTPARTHGDHPLTDNQQPRTSLDLASPRFISVRNAFISGLLLLAPIAVTWLVFRWLVDTVGGTFRQVVLFFAPGSTVARLEELLDHRTWGIMWDVVATGLVIVLVILLGYASRLFLGRYFTEAATRFVQSIPGVGTVYNTVKQIVDTFGAQDRSQFSKVVLVQFPRAGSYTLGFLTNTGRGEPHAHLAGEHWAVFVPTAPSPTNGYFLYLPRNEIIELEMSVGDGMKVVFSCGAVMPAWGSPAAARAALDARMERPAGA